ncbi:MAG TPA: hypothetical protein DDW50_05690 [Firmicutes bacterium]|nr:hypothetical protein [Bacillota bacterium]
MSDFSYGEKLFLINDGTGYAFVNLFEDEVFDEFNDIVRTIFKEHHIEIFKVKLAEVVNYILGISCDIIEGKPIDTSLKDEKCIQCGSKEFESNLTEPEQLTDIEVPIVTHNLWKKLSSKEKRENIERELQKRKYK